MWIKFLYANHPVRCIIAGHSECGQSVFLTNSILNMNNKYNKIYFYPPSLHHDLYQKLFKRFTNYTPIHIKPNKSIKDNIDIVIEEVINNKDFENSDTEMETYESIEELSIPQEYENKSIIILEDSNQKEMDDPRFQAMFKRSRHNNLSIFIISQDYYELKKTIRCNGNIYHIFKPNIFRDVIKLYQNKASMNMNLSEFKHLTSTCWNEKYQPLTIDMTKDKFTGLYILGNKFNFRSR